MTDTFRALCAELVNALEGEIEMYETRCDDLIARARAALANPDPVGPNVMEIIELHDWLEDEWRANNDGEDLPMVDFARAVLDRFGNR